MFLNPTASWIWRHADLPNVAEAYAGHYGIPLAQARADVGACFSAWRSPPQPQPLTGSPPPGSFAHQAVIRLAQTTFSLQFETAGIADELLPRLEGLLGSSLAQYDLSIHAEHNGYTLCRDRVPIAHEPLLTGARAQLLLEATRLATPHQAFSAILHAGACGDRHSALILAGPARSGKSTLCAALRSAGWVCYSDDSAPLDPDFQVVAMPFALMLRQGSWHLFPGTSSRPVLERWGEHVRFLPSNLDPANLPLAPVKALIFVNYQPAALTPALTPIDPFDALLELEKSGFWVDHTQPSIAAFLNWLAATPRYRLNYATLPAAVDLLTSALVRPEGLEPPT